MKEVFNNAEGNQSSKRLGGLGYLGIGAIMILADQFTKFKLDHQVLIRQILYLLFVRC